MKILVVDDELVSRVKMKKILESLGECTEAESGRQAVAEFFDAWEKGSPYELIALDISMPDLDGTQVLQQIREFEKSSNVPRETMVKIFMVTAQSDKDTIVSCIKAGCNDYITKPFSKETVMKKLGEAAGPDKQGQENGQEPDSKQDMLSYIIEQFKKGEIDLPPFPGIYAKFNELMDKDAPFMDIVDLLKQDPAAAAKLISISNSSYYRGTVENETLEQALGRLGMEKARQVLDAVFQKSQPITSNENYSGIMEKLWEHSLACAYAGQFIVESLDRKPARDIFCLSLFHDIGKLFLLQVAAEMERNEHAAGSPSQEDLEEFIQTNHSRAGSTLLIKWGFPEDVSNIVLYHENPGEVEAPSFELLVVHAADEIAKSMDYRYPAREKAEPAGNDTIRKLGLTPDKLEDIKGKVLAHMDRSRNFLK